MAIHVILGKPGSGKSMYGVMLIIRELLESQRNIVTNLPIHPDKLNEYLQRMAPGVNTRFVERLRLLTDDELREFWKYRGPLAPKRPVIPALREPVVANPLASGSWGIAPGSPEDTLANACKLAAEQDAWDMQHDWTEGKQGVAYFLDEAHIAFNARDWATIGRGALHYLSQHRKLGDIVFPITQSYGNLDKQFRSVAEDFTVLKNDYVARFGPFRGRGRFVRKTYLQEPGNNAVPFETATFTLDKEGVAACYDTARGIGVHGSKADIGRKAKGIPLLWVFPIALTIGIVAAITPWLFGRLMGKAMSSGALQKVNAATAQVSTLQAPPVKPPDERYPLPVAKEPAPAQGTFVKVEKATTPVPVWARGVMASGPRYRVELSDGRLITHHDGTVRMITEGFVLMNDGTRYLIRGPVTGGKPPPTAATTPARKVPVLRPEPPPSKAITPPPHPRSGENFGPGKTAP